MARIFSTAPAWTGTIGSGGVPDASITTIPLSSATGLTDGAYYILSIDRVDASGNRTPAKWEVVTGQLSGTNLINCQRGVEGTAQAHSAGATVEVLFTSHHWEQLKEYLSTEHNPDGTHKSGLILTSPVINTSFSGTAKASGSDINTGTDDSKIVTPKAIADSNIVNPSGTPAQGDILYYNGSAWTRLSAGTSGYFLKTQGPSANPTWAEVNISSDGWISANETWTYASSTSFTISGDLTGKYQKGDKIRLKQGGGYKYFYIIGVSYSSPNTTITITGGSDYSLTNSTITDNYYSKALKPQDFPNYFNWTPTVTAESGTPTVNSISARFQLSYPFIFIQIGYGVSNGSGGLRITFPFSATYNGAINGFRVDDGIAICGYANGSSYFVIKTYNNGYPSGSVRLQSVLYIS